MMAVSLNTSQHMHEKSRSVGKLILNPINIGKKRKWDKPAEELKCNTLTFNQHKLSVASSSTSRQMLV